ncbi:hypothetical protein Lal_00035188 [Lupinus albus]|nr:hypothetical protein Lal_00035188 [Lupinus albus]
MIFVCEKWEFSFQYGSFAGTKESMGKKRKTCVKMPGKPDTDDWRAERGEQIQFQSSIFSQSQPWWQGVRGNASKSSSADQQNGSVMNGVAQSETNEGLLHGVDFNKQMQPGADKSGGDVAKEHQSIKHALSSTPYTVGKHLVPNSQMELVGHSVVLTSYPYSDAQYGGLLTNFGQQAMINPQLYGIHHTRMPLPLEMEEEPVYVNAKQYHGILRRRQSRAKAELEKKVIKARKTMEDYLSCFICWTADIRFVVKISLAILLSIRTCVFFCLEINAQICWGLEGNPEVTFPYLHESRHLHALRRARGNGGRFLNTKKLEGNSSDGTIGNNNGANPLTLSGSSSAAHHLVTNNGILVSSNDQYGASQSMVEDIHQVQSFTIGYHDGNGLSSPYYSQLNGKKDGDCFGRERESVRMHGAPNGAVK